MVVNPETDLLIFKLRSKREEKKEVQEVVEKSAQHAPPTTVVETAPKVEAAPQLTVQKEIPPKMETLSQPTVQIPEAQPRMQRPQYYAPEKPAPYVMPVGSYDVVEAALREQGGEAVLNKRESKSEIESREAAHGKVCAWHPWRPAYAICEYCHRPFCFEDIVDHNKHYYCLEDVDKVAGPALEMGVGYNSLSFVAATLFLLGFVLFVIFANAQVAAVISYANSVGFAFFISRMTFSDAYAIFSPALMFFGLAAGVTIFARSRSSFLSGILTGVSIVCVLTYQYLNTGQLYVLAIDIITFIAMLALIYSRKSVEVSRGVLPSLQTESQFVGWPNAEMF